jgi:predicted nucleotidyltransferase
METQVLNKYGLTQRDIVSIREILGKYPEISSVFIFGSRAMGTCHSGSDIDLAIMNEGINHNTLRMLKNDFEESALPYTVDLVHFPAITQPRLKEHISQVGKLFYQGDTF